MQLNNESLFLDLCSTPLLPLQFLLILICVAKCEACFFLRREREKGEKRVEGRERCFASLAVHYSLQPLKGEGYVN